MPKFGDRSKRILNTCHPDIQVVCIEVVAYFDHSILSGHRGAAEQTRLFNKGLSKTAWPQSRHNLEPSMAVDIAPYPIDWDDIERFIYLAGHIMAKGRQLGIEMRWGGDWGRSNMKIKHSFKDWGHFEILG